MGMDAFSGLPGLVVLNGRRSPLSLYRLSSQSPTVHRFKVRES